MTTSPQVSLTPQVSVVIPTFNRLTTLPRALRSVQNQTFTDWELILVDDGSTDGTAEWTRDLQAAWTAPQKLICLRQENQGVSEARNQGVKNSSAEWIAFLDSDDEWLPKKLEWQLKLAASGTAPLIHGDEIWIRNDVRVNPKLKYKKQGGAIFDRCVEHCCISVTTTLIRRELFENLGGFRSDFKVCEDYELWLRVTAKYPVAFVEQPVAIKYGGHLDQLSTQFHSMDYYRVKALAPFFQHTPEINTPSPHAARVAVKKCQILLKGYTKHPDSKNAAAIAEVNEWLAKALELSSDPDQSPGLGLRI